MPMSALKNILSIASDHAGFKLKEILYNFLISNGYNVLNFGTNSTSSVNYPEFAFKVVSSIINNEVSGGILICGTGIGMAMIANKFPGIRAACCSDVYSAKMSKLHNNANILTLGGRMIGEDLAQEIVLTWINTDFEGGRHQRRIDMLDELPKESWIKFTGGK